MTRRAWMQMAVLAAVWGASYMFIKIALEDLHPFWLVFVRLVLGALVLLPFAVHTRALGGLRGRTRPLVALAVLQIVAPFLLITFGEQRISSSLTGILVSAAPIFTVLLAVHLDPAERSTGWALAGVVIGMLGVALLFGLDLTGDVSEVVGGLMVLGAALCYAAGALLLKRTMSGVPPVAVASSTIALSAVALLPTLPFTVPDAVDAGTIGAMVALGAGGTGLAFLVFYTQIAEIGPARASLVSYIAPGFSVLYGVLLLGEDFTAGIVVGLALILLGSYSGAQGRPPWRRRRGDAPPAVPEPAVAAGDAA